jgi:hypothetical protein
VAPRMRALPVKVYFLGVVYGIAKRQEFKRK